MKALLRRGQCKVYGYLWLKAYYEVRVAGKNSAKTSKLWFANDLICLHHVGEFNEGLQGCGVTNCRQTMPQVLRAW